MNRDRNGRVGRAWIIKRLLHLRERTTLKNAGGVTGTDLDILAAEQQEGDSALWVVAVQERLLCR
jgi:hypothetical protein